MFHHTLSNVKLIGKKGKDFVKSITVDTFQAIKTDIVEARDSKRRYKEWCKSNSTSIQPTKHE